MRIVLEHRLSKQDRALLTQALQVGESAAISLRIIAQALTRISSPTHLKLEGGIIVKTIPSNTPDIRFDILPVTAAYDVDSEGHRIQGSEIDVAGLSYPIQVDDAQGIEVIPDQSSPKDLAGNPLGGWLRVGGPNEDGSPRLTSVVFQVKDSDDLVLANLGGEQYNIVSGAAAGKAVVGGGFQLADPLPPADGSTTPTSTTPGASPGTTEESAPSPIIEEPASGSTEGTGEGASGEAEEPVE
jgi:hypothetical protein